MSRPYARLRALLGPLAMPLYAAAVARRNARFDRGDGVRRVPLPVVSIGNLSTGGTGKTPLVAWLAAALAARGVPPAIALRGYSPRGAPAGPQSDEARLYAQLLPGTPILANPDRAAAIDALLAAPAGAAVRCILLDDGFQHRRLHRDLDLVLIDASRGPLHAPLLPAGDLREPPAALRRASAVILTHAESASPGALASLAAEIAAAHGRPPIAVTRHGWSGLDVRLPGACADAPEPAAWLRGRRVLAVSAIGNPAAFLVQARAAAGGPLAGELTLRDHDPYGPPTLARLAAALAQAHADTLLTTPKDWVKLERHPLPVPVARPRLHLSFDAGEADLLALVLPVVAPALPAFPAPPTPPAAPRDGGGLS